MCVIYEDIQHFLLNYLDMDNRIYQQLTEHIEEYNEKAIHETIKTIFTNFKRRNLLRKPSK